MAADTIKFICLVCKIPLLARRTRRLGAAARLSARDDRVSCIQSFAVHCAHRKSEAI